MTQQDGKALLLTGPKSRRAEFAITEIMDAAIKRLTQLGRMNRSDACRLLMARGIAQDDNLMAEAVYYARDASEQATHRE